MSVPLRLKDEGGPMEPSFHPATAADIEGLVELMRQFYAIDQYAFIEQKARNALEQLLRDHTLGRIWLIIQQEEKVGYIVVTFGYSLEYQGRDAFIDELYISASQRSQGIGTKALRFVLENCPALGIHAVHLEVERSNAAGQALYRRAGFEDHQRRLMTKRIVK
jgi:diamine N-acetyltransferase